MTVMAAFVASRALGVLRQSALAYRFDTGPQVNAFLAAFRIPDLLFALVVGGALNSAFIPVFAGLLERGEEEEAWRLAASVLNAVVLALALLGGMAALFAPALAPLLAPGFDPPTQRLVGELSRILFLQPLFFGVGAVGFAILNARQHFLAPAWAPAVYNLFQLAALVFLTPSMGITGLAVGVVAGAVAYAGMQLPVLRRHGFRYAPALDWRSASFRRVMRLLVPRTLTLASTQVGHTVTSTVLASLVAGGVAALSYAYALLQLPWNILGVAVSTAAFPTLSALAGRGELEAVRVTLRSSLRAMLYVGVAASVLLLALARPAVDLLYWHGKFTLADAQRVSWVVAFYAPGLVAHLADELLPRAFFALQDTRTPLLITLAAVAANVVLSLLLLPWLGLAGLALALTLAAALEMALYLALLERRLPGLVDGALAREAAALLLAAAPAWLVATVGAGILAPRSGTIAASVAHLLVGGAAGAVVYALVAAALGVREHRRVLALGGALRRRVIR